MTINGETFSIKNIKGYSNEVIKLKGHIKEIVKEEEKANDIYTPKKQLNKPTIRGYKTGNFNNINEEIQPNTINIWDILRTKIQQIIPFIKQFKNSLNKSTGSKELELVKYQISEIEEKLQQAKNGEIHLTVKDGLKLETDLEKLNQKKEKLEKNQKSNPFSNMFSNIKKTLPKLNDMSSITIKIKNQIKQIGSGFKNGFGHILKYAGALFSLRSIYNTLSSSASAWLSSQNAGAQQLSANIEYMKYAMGSVFAPAIEYAINLVYQLMKAIQSLVYAFSGVNIFAKATASSMKNASGSAKEASKSLAGVHSEINNVSEKNNSGGGGTTSPNMDLSQMENTSNSILDAIASGNWYEVGTLIGAKVNEAMENIPWDKIHNTSRKIGRGIAEFFNGGIKETDWNLVGKTIAHGLNTTLYMGYEFVTTFDWRQFGIAIGNTINGFFENIDWKIAGKTLGEGVKGIFNSLSSAVQEIDWASIVQVIETFIINIDWSGIVASWHELMGSLTGAVRSMIIQVFKDIFVGIYKFFSDEVESVGGNIVLGILKGIGDAVIGIGQWIYDNVFQPFIKGFKDAFGIHSPSTVMAEMGTYIIDGLKEGIGDVWNKVKDKFDEFKTKVANKFEEVRTKISSWAEKTKSNISTWAGDTKNKISTWVGDTKTKIGSWAESTKQNVSTWGSNVKSKITECCNTISSKVSSGFDSMKNSMSNKLSEAKNYIDSWSNDTGWTFNDLSSDATTWGRDLVDNMAYGIRNNIGRVTSAVNSVASKIKSLIGFSEPEAGPLSNFHTYMPDMIDLMVKGIHSNLSKVTDELERMTGIMAYTINTDILPDYSSFDSGYINNKIKPQNVMQEMIFNAIGDNNYSNGQPISLNLDVYLSRTKLGQIVIEDLRDMKRQTGKDIEALIG